MHGTGTGTEADGAGAAAGWLAAAAPDPAACVAAWERNPLGVALLPAGSRWDVLIVPGWLGFPALEVLTRLGRTGPVLADFGDDRTGFFVPPGTAERWVGTGVRAAGRGTWIVVPYPGVATGGVRWVVRPEADGTLNDPVLLELALHEAAASAGPRGPGGSGDPPGPPGPADSRARPGDR
ncbi:hypothetical protein [Streptomyces zingiberis]|uniref:hypothetical protein n=1 Tax=Streptomyces zingiberis TaxID=2053010 RepID=UPI001F0DC652|nr:hypothetical protein [Streptomyces zingiberis]